MKATADWKHSISDIAAHPPLETPVLLSKSHIAEVATLSWQSLFLFQSDNVLTRSLYMYIMLLYLPISLTQIYNGNQ